MSPEPPIAGIADVSGAEAVRAEQVAASLRGLFQRYGFTPVVPPILESAVPFLDRSGEDIRRHMYIFTDPSGRELCLRPELTIPTVALYGRRAPDAPEELRAYYVGPAFRYAAPVDGGARQLTHAGIEVLGAADTELADAEVLAVAQASLVEHGVRPGRLVVSDIGFLQAAVQTDLLSDRSRAALARAAGDPDDLAAALDLAAAGPAEPDEGSELDELVAQLPDSMRAELLDRIIGGLEPESLGIRTAGEIAARLVSRSAARPVEPVPSSVDAALRALLAVELPLTEGLDRVGALADDLASPALAALVASWRRRVEMIAAYGIDPAVVTLRLGLRRGIDYYTSFIFEIEDPETGDDPLCAGGRYDELVGRLTGRGSVPGVGFGLAVEHLVRLVPPAADGVSTVVAVVVGEDASIPAVTCVAVASALRAVGLACRLAVGSSPADAGAAAGADGVPVLVTVGAQSSLSVVGLRSGVAIESVTIDGVAEAVREALDG
ncbi:MAG TPA: ATP phosphoribosyltransferase regulatory subunit [Iamia sp.]|jgi:ATP phosphoribosyltransferase regulatory subunit|nr:ATP phosphoribosyltransferase regulatory subunit [Iamia sp.]